MAYLIDQPGGVSEEERQRLAQQQGAPAAAPAVPGTSVGNPSSSQPAASGNFRDLSRYFSANRDSAGTVGQQAASTLSNEGMGALRGDDMAKGLEVQGRIDTAAGSIPGMTSEFQRQDSGYGAGMGKLDGYLMSQSGSNPFASLKETLSPRLGKIEAKQDAPAAPDRLETTGDFQRRRAEIQGESDKIKSLGRSQFTDLALNGLAKNWNDYVNSALGDYNAKGSEYEKQRQAYEAYRKRRAENIGDPYSELTQAFSPDSFRREFTPPTLW